MSVRAGHSGKVDLNQQAAIDALRACGVVVRSLAGIGGGLNDLLCAVPQATFLIEMKMPGEHLTPMQKKWHTECPWRNHIAYSPLEAVTIANYYRGKHAVFPGLTA